MIDFPFSIHHYTFLTVSLPLSPIQYLKFPHPTPSQFSIFEAPERLFVPLVAPFRSPLVLSDCWHCPSGHTLLYGRSIPSCIVWQILGAALSRLHRGSHTRTRTDTHSGDSPQWFLLTSLYHLFHVTLRLNHFAGDNSLFPTVIISTVGLFSYLVLISGHHVLYILRRHSLP